MSFPVFASGDVLNASDMNAVGLWLVKTQAVGSGVSSVTVTGAFSADYDAYRIIASGVASTGAGASANLQLSGITSGYYAGIAYLTPGSNAVTGSTDNNQAAWLFAGSYSSEGLVMCCDLINPFLARPTILANANYASHIVGGVFGKQTSSTSATGFTISTPGGTMTGGTIRVYGYRN